jgi:hypothetical protein
VAGRRRKRRDEVSADRRMVVVEGKNTRRK